MQPRSPSNIVRVGVIVGFGGVDQREFDANAGAGGEGLEGKVAADGCILHMRNLVCMASCTERHKTVVITRCQCWVMAPGQGLLEW